MNADTAEQLRIHNGRMELMRWEQRLATAEEMRDTLRAWEQNSYAGLEKDAAERLQKMNGLASAIAGLDQMAQACAASIERLAEFAEQPKKRGKKG